jgi:large subunit ribosomal protein L25
MKLSVTPREGKNKGKNSLIRRAGDIPAVVYSSGQVGDALAVSGADFDRAIRTMKKGHLPTTVFVLTDESGKERKAIVKDISYHRTTYRVEHLDFQELKEDRLLCVNVPIDYTGAAECPGVKIGGVVRNVIRHARVSCLPKDLPTEFPVSIQQLNLKGTRRLRDIQFPEGVRPLQNLDEVAVVIAKR